MRKALAPLLFSDEMSDEEKDQREPVAPAERSDAAKRKATTKKLNDGSPVHDFRSLLDELSLIIRSTCRAPGSDEKASSFEIVTSLNPIQRRALDLLAAIPPYPVR